MNLISLLTLSLLFSHPILIAIYLKFLLSVCHIMLVWMKCKLMIDVMQIYFLSSIDKPFVYQWTFHLF